MNTNTKTARIALKEVVNYFVNRKMPATADFFKGCASYDVTVDGMIDANFVRRALVIPDFNNTGMNDERIFTDLLRSIHFDVKF